MTNKELIKKFKNGATKGMASYLFIKDDKLIHYETIIAYRKDDKFYLNDRYYTPTTSRIQKHCKEILYPFELFRGDDFIKLDWGSPRKRASQIYN